MTIREIEERFCIPAEKLKRYESEGLIIGKELEDGTKDYNEDQRSGRGLRFYRGRLHMRGDPAVFCSRRDERRGCGAGEITQKEAGGASGKDPL